MKVDIKGAGAAQRFTASGPVCLVQLPASHYTVLATTDKGRSLSCSVDVGKGAKSLDFSF